MTSTIRLRMATPDDTDEILALDPEHTIYQCVPFPHVREIRELMYKLITVAVDVERGTIIGMIVNTESKLHSLFVLPEYRRRGVATMLVQKMWDTNTRGDKHWIIPSTTWPTIDGIRRKIKNIGFYSYEMFTPCKWIMRDIYVPGTYMYASSPYVICQFYTNPSLMGKLRIGQCITL